MNIVRLILAAGCGVCFGYAVRALFWGRLNVGLGVLAIGLFLAILWIVVEGK